ncbi:helix-turn-helix transcriptional regulator [Phenylobacterium sp. LjRoot225]|uniref:helix-turn-helix transcriptional regulator n=1 Tax=Phenylobacterium sp. LjRoot225 TaxID=3342285 RepID=UPI003ECDCAAB
MKDLLSAIGSADFDKVLLEYLHLVLPSDRIAVVSMSAVRDATVVDAKGHDPEYARLAAAQAPAAARADPASGGAPEFAIVQADGAEHATSRHLREARLTEEMRVITRLQGDRAFMVFLGRVSHGATWGPQELELAKRSLSLLHSVIIAHDRCHARVQNWNEVAPPSNESRLAQAFETRGLTRRESEIAAMILFGHSTLAVAMRLAISENTVKVHRKHLNQKLGVKSQSELFGFAFTALMQGERL